MEFLDTLKHYLNPHYIIETGGLVLLLLIVFAETGLFFGFFFPGDSLLFVAGLAVATGILKVEVALLIILVFSAAVIGNFVGYYFGYALGPRLFKKDDSIFFKKKYLTMTQSFYDRYGRAALILGRFLPFVRTFVPILAGAIKMHFGKFVVYNLVGALLWVPTFILAGYFLGNIIWVQENLEIIVVGLIIITIIPVIRTYFREKRKHAAEEAAIQQQKDSEL